MKKGLGALDKHPTNLAPLISTPEPLCHQQYAFHKTWADRLLLPVKTQWQTVSHIYRSILPSWHIIVLDHPLQDRLCFHHPQRSN